MIRKYAEIFCWKNVSSFCSAKATHIFSAKNIRILYIESAKTVNEMTLNELVKLTTLWTTGPCMLSINTYNTHILCDRYRKNDKYHDTVVSDAWYHDNVTLFCLVIPSSTLHMQTAKVQIRLCIYTVWSMPLLSAESLETMEYIKEQHRPDETVWTGCSIKCFVSELFKL